MKKYLVDFENVNSDGLKGILSLEESDEVTIFYSEKGSSISIEMHQQIMLSHANFYFIKVMVGGKNALDFQLSTYLGYLIAQNVDADYFIVSKDQGFIHVVNFWKNISADFSVNLVENVAMEKAVVAKKAVKPATATKVSPAKKATAKKAVAPKPAVKKTAPPKPTPIEISPPKEKIPVTESDIIAAFPDASEQNWLSDIVKYLNNANDKATLYNNIRKKLGQDKGSIVYKSVKKLLQ